MASCLLILIQFIVKDTLCTIRFVAKFELPTQVLTKTRLKSLRVSYKLSTGVREACCHLWLPMQ